MKNGNGHKIVKSFEKWSDYDVAETFGLTFVKETPSLKDWLSVTGSVPADVQKDLTRLCDELTYRVGGWNEQELLARFVFPLLYRVDFANRLKKIETFAGRTLVLPDDIYDVQGNVDWFVARGGYEPQTPYFFLHEYKRFKHGNADPLGQLLIAMLAAQKLNADGLAVYGVWIVGSAWSFVLLDGNIYTESYPYEAKKPEDLTQIWLILNKTKQIIYDRVDKIIAAEKEAAAQTSPV